MNVDHWIKAVLIIAGFFIIRVIAKYRVDRKRREALLTPLIDPVKFETLFVPREGEDANLVEELRDTIAHLNRQAYAEEFYGLDAQIAALDGNLPARARNTLRAVMIRLLETDERWLQLVAAKTCSRLNISDAVPRLEKLLEGTTPEEGGRYREELEKVTAELTA